MWYKAFKASRAWSQIKVVFEEWPERRFEPDEAGTNRHRPRA